MANTKITTNVIADDAVTSDKLGGDLTMPGHVSLADNKELRIGTGNDLVIKHDATDTIFTNTTGNLVLAGSHVYIANAAVSEYMGLFIADGAASLRFNNIEELATVSGGVYIPNELGIGTNAPGAGLEVLKSGGGKIRISETAAKYVEIIGYAEGAANGSTMAFHTNQAGTSTSTERMRIDHSGNVSIGNSSVAFPSGEGLQVYSSGNPRIKLANSTTGVASGDGTQFYLDGADVIYDNKDAGNQRWYTGGAERMRIDSSGNVGIGASPAYGKLDIRQTGTGAQDRGLYLEVSPSSSGSNYNAALISAGNGNLTGTVVRIHHESPAANQKLLSLDTTGSNTEKFWVDEDGDAYLAGNLAFASGKGIDFSATGSGSSTSGQAHILDEYEFGSWTPTCHTGSATFVSPYYVKIGRVIHFSFQVHQFTDTSTASSIDIRGLPFPCLVGQATGTVFGIYLDTEVDSVYVNTAEELFFYELTNSGWYAARHSDINSSSAYFYVGGTYITSS